MARKIIQEKEMSFLDHVEILRWHLVRSSFAIILVSVVAFVMKDFIFNTILFAPKDANFITYRFFVMFQKYLVQMVYVLQIFLLHFKV